MGALWAADKNRVDKRKVFVSCKKLYFWLASCRLHYRLMRVDSVQQAVKRQRKAASSTGSNGSSGSNADRCCLRCPVCDPAGTEISRHVRPVHAAADATGELWVAEVHCVQGHCSPADLYFPEKRLAVQVDGAGHTDVQVHGKTLEQQQRTDAFFDNEVVRQGLRALRIHWRDANKPAADLAAALSRCRQQPAAAFVMYSSSYGRPIKVAVDTEHWEEVDKRQQQPRRQNPSQRCAPCTASAAQWCRSQI